MFSLGCAAYTASTGTFMTVTLAQNCVHAGVGLTPSLTTCIRQVVCIPSPAMFRPLCLTNPHAVSSRCCHLPAACTLPTRGAFAPTWRSPSSSCAASGSSSIGTSASEVHDNGNAKAGSTVITGQGTAALQGRSCMSTWAHLWTHNRLRQLVSTVGLHTALLFNSASDSLVT